MITGAYVESAALTEYVSDTIGTISTNTDS